jgi:predicted metal-dependent hydrolase
MSESLAAHPLYLKGIEYFNECEFFEAHEAWEELWSDHQGPSRRYFQGLIQAAVCLHHYGNGNCRGATKLYHSSRRYLEGFCPTHLGLNVQAFMDQLQVCCGELLESTDEFPRVEIDPELIPEIHLQPF